MDIIYSITTKLLALYFKLFYHFKIYGIKKIHPGGAIIASNHASFLDPPLVSVAWPEKIYFLARASLFESSFFGWLIKNLHAYPVEGSTQDLNSFKTIQKLLEEGKKVLIFPEGYRSENGSLNPLKTGVAMMAQRTGSPIIPAYIHGTFEAWSRNQKWPKSGSELSCSFGEPIYPQNYAHLPKKEAREAITQKLQASIEELRASLQNQKK